MSADSGNPRRPRLSNGSYPASEGSGPETVDSSLPDQRPDVPTPADRVLGLLEEYPDRMNTPLSETHGRTLRESVMDERENIQREVDVGSSETITVSETVAHPSGTWLTAVWDLLETYEKYRDMHLRMVRRGRTIEDEEFTVPLGVSFSPEYQSATYAKLMALQRQLIGESPDDSPTGEAFTGAYDEPVTVLFGLTASAYRVVGESGSGHRPVTDHDREIRGVWSGSSSSVKRSLRYVLEDKLGLSSEHYAWWWQSEPHPGDGAAAAYSHSHPIVIFDGARSSVPVDEISEETFRSVVAKHVAECEGAEWSGHQIREEGESAVRVRKPDEIQDFGSYVSKYLSLGPDQDLLERSDEYIMWAASQWATATQKYSKSKTATAAIKADACHQRYADPEAEQSVDHGERVVRSEKPGVKWECAECGSHFQIDQSPDTLTEMRVSSPEVSVVSVVATDGGEEEDGPPQRLEDRWPSADGAARVGAPVRVRECDHPPGSDQCPLCASETESPDHTVSGEAPIPDHAEAPDVPEIRESFEREPQWQPDAIVRQWSGEETAIGSPGGTVFTEVVVEGAGSISEKCDLSYLPRVSVVDGPEPWRRTDLFSEADVREGRVPPPELVAREWAETVQTGRRVTPKEWHRDWYTRRFEQECDVSVPVLSESERDRVLELYRNEGVESGPAICGRLQIDPSKVGVVEAVVGGGG